MKLKIKVKKFDKYGILPTIINKGEWIDLRSRGVVKFCAPQAGTLKKHKIGDKEVSHRDVTFDFQYIPLGIAMKLPKGFEAHVLPRSSTFKNFGITMANSQGIIDNSYSGNSDEWAFPAIAYKDTLITDSQRICQFRIQLSQKATFWQKLKWFLSSGIKIIEVESLDGTNRGGFGSTGVK